MIFVVVCHLSEQESYNRLQLVFHHQAPSLATVYNWFNEFKRGRSNLTDDLPEGRPPTAMTEDNTSAVRLLIWTSMAIGMSNVTVFIFCQNRTLKETITVSQNLKCDDNGDSSQKKTLLTRFNGREYRREGTSTAVVFHPLSESSGGSFPLYHITSPLHQAIYPSISPSLSPTDILFVPKRQAMIPLWLEVSMGDGDHLLSASLHVRWPL
ncbi:Putative uncharacterized protein FLJ37770 [Eumeta japonica]|uniref:Mos1 transposase HTH domain-containing protein n=1 Tax=Eumeta variegata TaxID=151549 RepID=A0A4C1WLU7_EUMVA|nr:Putative uncharacterized protein FLJ37770 [Eumeta japonica]